MSENTSRKTCVEEVLERFDKFRMQLLQEIPELRSLSLVLDWEIGINDFPHALMLGRNEQMNMQELLGNSKQTQKLLRTQIEMIGAGLNKIQNLVDKKNQD